MKKFLFLFLVFILAAFLLIGCATIPQIETETYQKEELKPFIGVYLETFGEPIMQLHGKHYTEKWHYVELYWHIDNFWYLVILVQKDGEWRVTYDEFKLKRA